MLDNIKRFVDPSKILAYSGLKPGQQVADFGCGNGFYPIAAAELVGSSGNVYAVDVVPEALEATVSAAKSRNLKNVYTIRHDMEKPGVPIRENSCDSVILSGILHLSKLQKNVLRESYKVLKSGGELVIIEWKKERLPFGPSIENRLSEDDVKTLLAQSGFRFVKQIPADYFHHALIFTK